MSCSASSSSIPPARSDLPLNLPPLIDEKYTLLNPVEAPFVGRLCLPRLDVADKLSALPKVLFTLAAAWLHPIDRHPLPQLNFTSYLQTKEEQTTLKHLDLSNSMIDDAGLEQVLEQFPSLTSLSLHGCRNITASGLRMLTDAIAIRPITHLDVSACGDEKITIENWLEFIVQLSPQLQNFNFSFPANNTPDLERLIRAAPLSKMAAINIHYCGQALSDELLNHLTGQLAQNQTLKTLNLRFSFATTDQISQLMRSLNSQALSDVNIIVDHVFPQTFYEAESNREQIQILFAEKFSLLPNLRNVKVVPYFEFQLQETYAEMEVLRLDPDRRHILEGYLATLHPQLQPFMLLIGDKNSTLKAIFEAAKKFICESLPSEELNKMTPNLLDMSALLFLSRLINKTPRFDHPLKGDIAFETNLQVYERSLQNDHPPAEHPVVVNDQANELLLNDVQDNDDLVAPPLPEDFAAMMPPMDPLGSGGQAPDIDRSEEIKIDSQKARQDEAQSSPPIHRLESLDLLSPNVNPNQNTQKVALLILTVILLANRYLFSSDGTVSVD